jgi:hypothetical protein
MANRANIIKLICIYSGLTVAGWLWLGWLFINLNLAPFGWINYNWPQPAGPTAVFDWGQVPPVIDGTVTIPKGETYVWHFTAPRVMTEGVTTIKYSTAGSIYVTADEKSSDDATPAIFTAVVNEDGAVGTIDWRWNDLAVTGKKITFRIKAIDKPLTINQISIKAKR